MDFTNMLVVVVGLGTAAFIAVVLAGAMAAGLRSAWFHLAHRHETPGMH